MLEKTGQPYIKPFYDVLAGRLKKILQPELPSTNTQER
jgi:hypothetical protein